MLVPAPVLVTAGMSFSPLSVVIVTVPAVTPPALAAPAPAPVVPAPRRASARPALRLDRVATSPGAPVTATGSGCDPDGPVVIEVDRRQVGTAIADADGAFSQRVTLPDLGIGRYEVVARCGPVLTTTIDVVLSSRVEPSATALALLALFILLALAVIRRQRTQRVA